MDGALMRYFRISSELRDPVGDDHRHAGEAEFERHGAGRREGRMRPRGRPPIWPPRRGRSAAARGQAAARALDLVARDGTPPGSSPRTGAASAAAAAPEPRRTAPSGGSTSERRLPGRTRSLIGPSPMPPSLSAAPAGSRRGARSADDRHRWSAARRGAGAPPARRAAAPGGGRHRRASSARGPAARPRRTG